MGAINFDSVLALGLSLLPYDDDDDDAVYHSTDLGIKICLENKQKSIFLEKGEIGMHKV